MLKMWIFTSTYRYLQLANVLLFGHHFWEGSESVSFVPDQDPRHISLTENSGSATLLATLYRSWITYLLYLAIKKADLFVPLLKKVNMYQIWLIQYVTHFTTFHLFLENFAFCYRIYNIYIENYIVVKWVAYFDNNFV